ncbi:MAG: Ig-like domain-containing protein [Actinomycetota bacterium]|nr:Ig-like domain-containing protein [Actinomycetota bacterium]
MNRPSTRGRPVRLGLAFALAVGLAATGLIATSAPASAAVNVDLAVADGTVGVSETVTATIASTSTGIPAGVVTFTAGSQEIGARAVGGALGSKAQLSWTPSSAGAATVVAAFKADDGQSASDSAVAQIAKVDTASTMVTPGTAATSAKVQLTATVLSRVGQYVPTGKVTFLLSDNTVIGTATLDAAGHASVTYTVPASSGTVTVLASYGGDANANASKTAKDTIKVTAANSSVSLVVPQTNYVNTSVVLKATITPTTATGTVDFAANGTYLGTGKVDKGSATLTWVPNALGSFTMTAKYSGGGGVNAGNATNTVVVVPQLKVDQITLVQAGTPGAWVPGRTTTLANGSNVSLTATSASGQSVQLAVVGPCSLSGNVLRVDGVGGTCTLTASTKGGSGYAPASQKYTVQTAAGVQTARIVAPKSGTYARGMKLRLSRVSAMTNVGQSVRWRVTRGTANCKIVTRNGFYKVKLVRVGKCTVRAYAPPLAGQWAAFKAVRFYRIR